MTAPCYEFVGLCVTLPAAPVTAMVERAREIRRRTFVRWAGLEAAAPAWDWHVRYYRSAFKGRPCVFMDHSAIEHVYAAPAAPGRS